jgi:hypothetical protein
MVTGQPTLVCGLAQRFTGVRRRRSVASVAMSMFSQEFQLPNGAKMKNRLCKAAMTEHMADPQSNLPNEKHIKVYEAN